MIVTTARQYIKPECIEAYHKLVKEITIESNKEAGCIKYINVRNEENPAEHIFIEFWKDQASIDFHVATPHFQTIVPQFKAFFSADEICDRFEVVADVAE